MSKRRGHIIFYLKYNKQIYMDIYNIYADIYINKDIYIYYIYIKSRSGTRLIGIIKYEEEVILR